ncbi:DUF3987 domain-containing protein [Sphingomonas montana]|uniref:DUF3987 domain-containing protein n=1 Tax=Sphingomonas montana TaxID=1843236 RepID=UPI0009FA1CEB|nr:DUF3987 domain-containing protein [Sphingomonas montana]
MQTIPQGGREPQPAYTVDDIEDWPAVTSFEFDPSALFAEAARASLRAPVSRQPVHPKTEPAPAGAVTAVDHASSGASGMSLPPGIAGELARFIYQAAPRPVAEVALVGALGLLAGICGREWNISGSGLNVYIVLVARSGIGKEAMHQGVSRLIAAARRAGAIIADEFVSFDDFVSGSALVKGCLHRQSFVNVAGEIGHKFRMMADDRDPIARGLRKQMTTLYSKSGHDDTAGGLVYSNTESSVASVQGVAFSLIGESTPGTFFESLTPAMMEDGFMSRFNVVEYAGDRPDKNPSRAEVPPPALVRRLVDLMSHSQTLRLRQEVQHVALSDTAASQLDAFGAECDDQIRAAGDDESRRQMWNRAHLKALRMAALLAVGDNHLHPIVGDDHTAWAIGLVRGDIAVFSRRISSGEVGAASDDARERKLAIIISEYIRAATISPGYKVPPKMHEDGLVPRHYLQRRVSTLPAFFSHKLGASKALDDTLKGMVANGWLMECKKSAVVESYGHHGVTYRVLGLPD